MIDYTSFKLDNGLKVIHHFDETTPLAVVNILYDVGAKDEDESRTGFAHLFEHLMFGGSKNIPNFDTPLQRAGGECNAFTSNDITNYYNTLPAQNIEMAFWLESDRMNELAFTEKSLEVQRGVVIEEFKQRYLNQPYGDVWLQLRPLIYHAHPYKWATIGQSIEHIEQAEMEDVKRFFYKHYSPQNATLVVGGNLELAEVKRLSEKYFAPIPAREKYVRNILPEPAQLAERRLEIERDVPADAIYLAFRMGGRMSAEHHIADLFSDILAGNKSSRLYNLLLLKHKLMTNVSAYITGAVEDGLFIISGNLNKGATFDQVENLIWETLEELRSNSIPDNELQKVKNKLKTRKVFAEKPLLNRVMNIAFFENLGALDQLNDELNRYDLIGPKDLLEFAQKTFKRTNSSTLIIKSTQS